MNDKIVGAHLPRRHSLGKPPAKHPPKNPIAGRERVRKFHPFPYLLQKYGGQRRDRTAAAGLFRAA